MSRSLLLAVLILIAPASLFVALLCGSMDLSAAQVLHALAGRAPGLAHDVIWELRGPRVLAAFGCGALLALAGTLLQVLLRNPLADPYIFGVSGGAALGALAAMLLGAGLVFTDLCALAGALLAIAIVFGLSFRAGEWNLYRLLLTGVVLSSGFSALISLLLVLAPQAALKGMLFWLMGDLSHAEHAGQAWIMLLGLGAFALLRAHQLNVLGLGNLKARSLGVSVARLQLEIYFCAAAATVAAVVVGGAIGFIGLLIPHAIRMLGLTDHRLLLPAAMLAGGSFLTLADTLARTWLAPQQLPVGVLTALLGVPAMLVLLSGRR